jgi:hypothetical protein
MASEAAVKHPLMNGNVVADTKKIKKKKADQDEKVQVIRNDWLGVN